jgi:hypothetical protein
MCALLAASYPLPPAARTPFLEHCAREIANLPELGDGVRMPPQARPPICAGFVRGPKGGHLREREGPRSSCRFTQFG